MKEQDQRPQEQLSLALNDTKPVTDREDKVKVLRLVHSFSKVNEPDETAVLSKLLSRVTLF